MKLILLQFIIALVCTSAFAQTYNTACEVPDILKEGYKGRVKKVTRETYDTKNISGKLIREKLTNIAVDSYDIKGFLRKTIRPTLGDSTTYQYDSGNKPVSCIYYDNGHPDTKKLLQCIDKYSYQWISYEYDKTKKQFSKTINSKELTKLNTNFLFDRLESGLTYNYFSGTDTVIYNSTEQGLAVSRYALEKDDKGNITKALISTGGITSDGISICKYEYYE